MALPDNAQDILRKYALQNAVRHGGAADAKALVGKVLGAEPALRPHGKELAGLAATIVAEVNALAPDAQRAALEKLDPALLAAKPAEKVKQTPLRHLEDWDKVPQIVMRFAPNPNGPATVGHSRGMVIHTTYEQMYKELGRPFKMILRYDDTDPAVKPPILEAYDAIRKDFEWLGGTVDQVLYASDRVPVYYDHANQALEAGHAYACTCEAEAFRELKNKGVACPCRDLPVATHLERWQTMLDGGYAAGGCVVRIKTDIQHKDPALRDWVALRIVTTPHPRVGDKYRVWPLLDFESAIEDHLQGVTHIVRGKDLIDSEHKQKFLYEYRGWAYPRTTHWGRVKVHEFGKVSKSLFTEGVKTGKYAGWDDVRLPTLAALRRRGFRADALRNFWTGLGISERDVAVSTDNLEAENRKLVEPDANRYFFVATPRLVEIYGLPPGGVTSHAPTHPDHPERGMRSLKVGDAAGRGRVYLDATDVAALRVGETFRLKDWGNLKLAAPGQATWAGNDLQVLKQGAKIFHWASPERGAIVPLWLVMPDEEVTVQEGVVEAGAAKDLGKVVQFERVGFARIEAQQGPGLRAVYSHA